MDDRKAGGRVPGFDVARVAAAAAVFFQHGCTLVGHDDWPEVGGLRVGRVGTAVFFGLSGYLAAVTSHGPEAWLWQRLKKLFPAYWVVTALSFVATAAVGYRAFGAPQVVSQFLGLGLFTHPDNLVNVVTWFVSALLVLYLISYLAMRLRWVVPAAVLATVAVSATPNPFEAVAATTLPFWAGHVAARAGRRRAAVLLAAAAGCAALAAVEANYWYGAVALPMMAALLFWPGRARVSGWVGAYTWEWFLLHGLCLHFTVRYVSMSPAVVFPVAAVLSFAAAAVLRHGLAAAGRVWAGRAFRLPPRVVAGIINLPSRFTVPDSSPPPTDPDSAPRNPPCSTSSAAASSCATGPAAATSSPPAASGRSG